MKLFGVVLVSAAIVVPALAQSPSIQSTSLPPLQQQWLREGAPPVQQAPAGANADDNLAPAAPEGHVQSAPSQSTPSQSSPSQSLPQQSGPPSADTTPATTPAWPNVWLPAAAAKIKALDKVDAQATDLTIKVGQSAKFGSLTITVKSCMVRPSDQPADATAYLDVTDSNPDTAPFNGWLLEAEPSLSIMQNPLYDLRITGCV